MKRLLDRYIINYSLLDKQGNVINPDFVMSHDGVSNPVDPNDKNLDTRLNEIIHGQRVEPGVSGQIKKRIRSH